MKDPDKKPDEQAQDKSATKEAPAPAPVDPMAIAKDAKPSPPKGWVGEARPTHRYGADETGVIWFIAGQYSEAIAQAESEYAKSVILATYRNPTVGMLRWQ